MSNGLEALTNMEYPGRFIAIGRDKNDVEDIIVYGITGRSPSSQARKLVLRRNTYIEINVEPKDRNLLNSDNIDLLKYTAILIDSSGIAVSNGRQTSDIYLIEDKHRHTAIEYLIKGHSRWPYEPDRPHYTPRISGRLVKFGYPAIGIIKHEDGYSLREYFEFPKIPEKGKLVTTYTGFNSDPLQPFNGELLPILLEGNTSEDTAKLFYEALSPKNQEKDFRVSIAAVHYLTKDGICNISIINRAEGGKIKNYNSITDLL